MIASEHGEHLCNAEFFCILLYDVPDHPFCHTIAPTFSCSTDTPEQPPCRDSGRCDPAIDRHLDPLGHRDSPNVAAFADEIDYGPMFLVECPA